MIDRHTAVTRCYPVPGQMWPRELCWLYDTVSQSTSHVEVGVYCGRSLMASVAGMRPGSLALAVDLEHTETSWVRDVLSATIREIARCNTEIEIQTEFSNSIQAARSAMQHGKRFDSVFIDGDHEYESVVADITEWKPLVLPGGILCGHDYSTAFPGVMDAVNELCPGFEVVPSTRIWFLRM